MTMKFVVTALGANIWADGKVFTVPSSHPRWQILSLAFKDKNEALVAWVLNDAVKSMTSAAAEADARFVPEGNWLSWQASEAVLPVTLPAPWKAAAEAWVAAGYDLGPLARFLGRTEPAQWELAALAVGSAPVFDLYGNLLVSAQATAEGMARVGRGGLTWIEADSLSAPRGYVEGRIRAQGPTEDQALLGPGRWFDRRLPADFHLEVWTGKQWDDLYAGKSLIQAIDQVEKAKETASKVRVRALLDGLSMTILAATNPDMGFQVSHQAEGSKTEVILATVFQLSDAQAIMRHVSAPGHLRIRRNKGVLVERMN